LAYRGAVRAARAAYLRPPRFVPHPLGPVIHGSNRELFRLVARTERWHLKHGRYSMPDVLAAPAED
ncbi:MAG: hypothetical protein J0H43_16045, partial [Actinobacteria bacterium]|nr:hypothetical protein [Actinomycetota bacterium]